MDVKIYMNEDLKFIEGLVKELSEHISEWSSDKVLEQADVVFHAFHKRFALEDFLLRQVKPTGEMKKTLDQFLKTRRLFRESLENILMLHVDEPDFRIEIGKVLKEISSHMLYLKTEFEPKFVDKISPDQMTLMAANLDSKIRVLSFS